MIKKACPISRELADESLMRFVAGEVFFLSVVIFLLPQWYLSFFLMIDFALRGFLKTSSPLKFFAIRCLSFLNKKGKRVNIGPKKFAMKIGFWVSLIMTILAFLKLFPVFRFATILLALASGGEAFFGFCLGCKIFPYWQMIKTWLGKNFAR